VVLRVVLFGVVASSLSDGRYHTPGDCWRYISGNIT
jgi:hypothetical protein